MQNELDVLRDMSAKLQELGIPFMLTGSMAMSFYAPPRMTRDIDIVLELGPDDVSRLVARLEPEYYVSSAHAREAQAKRGMFNVIHQESVIKVDCVVRKDTEYRRVEFDRRRRVTIQGFETFLASKEDLILSKLVWARDSRSELQLNDVKNLLLTPYETDYVERWASVLGVTNLLAELRHA